MLYAPEKKAYISDDALFKDCKNTGAAIQAVVPDVQKVVLVASQLTSDDVKNYNLPSDGGKTETIDKDDGDNILGKIKQSIPITHYVVN
ncbi:hypothetical protein AAVH_24423 [Aphelenchoides avenae]|nr:hypothetical protein AAVH_24423 [Aphelenchus avenae]